MEKFTDAREGKPFEVTDTELDVFAKQSGEVDTSDRSHLTGALLKGCGRHRASQGDDFHVPNVWGEFAKASVKDRQLEKMG